LGWRGNIKVQYSLNMASRWYSWSDNMICQSNMWYDCVCLGKHILNSSLVSISISLLIRSIKLNLIALLKNSRIWPQKKEYHKHCCGWCCSDKQGGKQT
jgi:hypothetical protein